jgi:hypothetical protein
MSNTIRSRSASRQTPQSLPARRSENSKVEMWSQSPVSKNLSPAAPRSPGRLEKRLPLPVSYRRLLPNQASQQPAPRHRPGLHRPCRQHPDLPPRPGRSFRRVRALTIPSRPPGHLPRQSSLLGMARGPVHAKRPPSRSNPADSGKDGSSHANRRPRARTKPTNRSRKIRRPTLIAGRRRDFRLFP